MSKQFVAKVSSANNMKANKNGITPFALKALRGFAPRELSFMDGTSLRVQLGLEEGSTDQEVLASMGGLYIFEWEVNPEGDKWANIVPVTKATVEDIAVLGIPTGKKIMWLPENALNTVPETAMQGSAF